jgi:hypothetical protein
MNTEAAEQGVVVGQLMVGVNDLGQALAELPEQRQRRWGYLFMAGTFAVFSVVSTGSTGMMVAAGVIAWHAMTTPRRIARAMLAGRTEADADTRIEVHEDRIVLANPVCRTEIQLAGCLAGIETSSAFFLYTTPVMGQPLYKRAFSGEADLQTVRRRVRAIPWRKPPVRAWIGPLVIGLMAVWLVWLELL